MGIYWLRNGLQLTIRPGIVDDGAELTSLVDKCAGQSDFLTFNQGEYITDEAQCNMITELSQEKNGLLLVAEMNGKMVANLIFRRGKRPKVSHAGDFGIIVEQDYWGMGIGKLLIEELIQWATGIGELRKINLKVRTDNERGIALYKTLGFSTEGQVQREFLSRGVFYDALFMGMCIN